MPDFRDSRAYKYAVFAASDNSGKTPKYVRRQCEQWLEIVDNKADYACFDEAVFGKIEKPLRLMVHPDLGGSMLDGLEDYVLLYIAALFCTKTPDGRQQQDVAAAAKKSAARTPPTESGRRYYTTGLLEIARKNFKTFTSAVIFIIALLICPKFSRLFSVAPDLKLSSELKVAIRKIIKSSPALEKHFKVMRSEVRCGLTDTEYTPLAYSKDKLDGKLAHVFLADEVGAMDSYPVEAMRSSQIVLKDKLGILISTQYPTDDNGFLDEKSERENVNYKRFLAAKNCFACGGEVIDYGAVERFILALPKLFGVEIMQCGYDRYNALSTVQKLESDEYNPSEYVELKQHSSVLHTATKLLKEKILAREFEYDDNALLEINFENARCTEDTNLNKYVNKKRSAGKVDMVVALINAVKLAEVALCWRRGGILCVSIRRQYGQGLENRWAFELWDISTAHCGGKVRNSRYISRIRAAGSKVDGV